MSIGLEDKRTWAREARRRLQMRLQAAQEDVKKGEGSSGLFGYFAKAKAGNYDELVKDATVKKKLAEADQRVDDLYEEVERLVHRPREATRLEPFTVRYKDACAKATTAVDGNESDMQAATLDLENLERDLIVLKGELQPVAEAVENVRQEFDASNELADKLEAKATVARHRELLAKYRAKADEFYRAADNCEGSEVATQASNLHSYVANLRELGKLVDKQPVDQEAKAAMKVILDHELDVEELLGEYEDLGPPATFEKKSQDWQLILTAKAKPLPQLKAGATAIVQLHNFLDKETAKLKQQKQKYQDAYNRAVETYNTFLDQGPKAKAEGFDLLLSEYEMAGDSRHEYEKTIPKLTKLTSDIGTAQQVNDDAQMIYEADLESLDEQLGELRQVAPPETVNEWDRQIAAVRQTAADTSDYSAASDKATDVGDRLIIAVEQWKTKREQWLTNPLRGKVQTALTDLKKTEDGVPYANLLNVDLVLADRLAQDGQYSKAQSALESLAQRAEQQKLKIPEIRAARKKHAELQRQFGDAYNATILRIEKFKAEVAKKKSEFGGKKWDDTQLGKTCKAAWTKATAAAPLINVAATVKHFAEPLAMLAELNRELDKLFDNSGTPTGELGTAVDQEVATDVQETQQRQLAAAWENLRREARELLAALSDLGSIKFAALETEVASQENLARAGDYEHANPGLSDVLVKLREDKTSVTEGLNRQRTALKDKAKLLRDKLTEFGDQDDDDKDVVITECYEAIDEGLKALEKQIASGRAETLQVLDKKLADLTAREANAATKADEVKAALARFVSDVKKPLLDGALGKYTPNRLLQLQAEADKLAAVKLQLEPAKLIERVDRLKPRIAEAVQTAKDIAVARTKVKEAATIVEQEFTALGTKMDKAARERGTPLPRAKDYAQLKVDAERYKTTALASEDLAIVEFHRVQLDELAKQIRSAQSLSDEFVEQQLGKMSAQRTEDIKLERAKKDFAQQLKDFFDSPLYEAAKIAANETGDISKINLIERLRGDAETAANSGDVAGARSRLKLMEIAAAQAQQPAKGLTADLTGLLANWDKALLNLEHDVKELSKAIVAAGDQHTIDGRVIAAVKKLPTALKPLQKPTKLAEDVAVLGREAAHTDKLAARERSLIVVRRHLKYLTNDPLFRLFADNPFGKKVRLAAACNALRQLNLNLLKANA